MIASSFLVLLHWIGHFIVLILLYGRKLEFIVYSVRRRFKAEVSYFVWTLEEPLSGRWFLVPVLPSNATVPALFPDIITCVD